MMHTDTPGITVRAPFIYALFFLVAYHLHAQLPLRFIDDDLRIAGFPLVLMGMTLLLGAHRELARAKTAENPHHPTTAIVTRGPYAITRNPYYLSFFLVYIGAAFVLNSAWAIIFLPLLVIYMRYAIIEREERYLEKKFGEEYINYKGKVKRWVGVANG